MPAPTTVAMSSGQAQGRQHRFSRDELMATIRQEALRLGLGEDGARAAQAVAETEGGLTNKLGDVNQQTGAFSIGPFQFHYGGRDASGKPLPSGQLTNFAKQRTGGDIAAARELILDDPQAAIRWALQGYLGQAIRQGQERGLQGAKLAVYAQRTGQVSEQPELAGQNYSALFPAGEPAAAVAREGAWKGGMRMPEPDVQETQRNEALDALKAYIEDLKDADASLQAKWADAMRREATASQRSQDKTLSPQEQAQAGRDYWTASQERARIENELEANAVAMRQAQRDYATTSRAVTKSLDDYAKRIDLAIRAGSLTLAQGKQQWDRAMEGAQAGVSGLISGYGALRQFLPSMGNRGMERALYQSLKDWEKYGAGPVPDFEFPIIPVNPLDDVKAYLPPAEQVQAQWKQGFNASGAGDEALQAAIDIAKEAARRQAQPRPAAPANRPGELPSQNWPGPIAAASPAPAAAAPGELPSQGWQPPPAPVLRGPAMAPQAPAGPDGGTSQLSPSPTTPVLRARLPGESMEAYIEYIKSASRQQGLTGQPAP